MHARTITAAAVAAGTLVGSMLAVTPSASASASPKAVPNSKPAWTAHAKHLGAAKSTAAVTARVYLAPKGGEQAVKDFAAAVSTPGNAAYRHFLTAAQYQAKFGTSAATAKSVSAYLRSSGLKVTGVAANNRYLTVTGTAKTAKTAFGARLDRYQHNGQTVQAPSASVTLPASVAANVLTVTGLDTTKTVNKPASTPADPPPDGFKNARPCSLSYGQISATYAADYHTKLPKFNKATLPYSVCGYTGPQFRSAYEGNTKLDGSGVSVAIVDAYAAPTIVSDANTYASQHGDGSYAAGQFVQTKAKKFTNAADCGPSGWYGEETLDVEAVHAMATGARIHYYGAASCFDSDLSDSLQQVVEDDDVSIVTNSYGDTEANESGDQIAAYESTFLQGAIEGISFLFSSGDDGDELAASGIKQADYPTSDPYVTSVGGTSTAIDATGTIKFQAGWGTEKYTLSATGKSWTPLGYIYGAGGGASALFNQPSYQAKATTNAYRQTPDVAMDADPTTGMLVGETQTFPTGVRYDEYRIGGTSLASPLFAGLTALSVQKAGGTGIGLLNPTIYKHTAAFTDVQGAPADAGNVRVDYANGIDGTDGLLYSVRTFGQDSSLAVTKGYDEVTGLGTPNKMWLSALVVPKS